LLREPIIHAFARSWDDRQVGEIAGSPAPGGSILTTSAPKSDRIVAAASVALAFQLLRRARGEGRFRLRDDRVLSRLVQIRRRHILPSLVEAGAELLEE